MPTWGVKIECDGHCNGLPCAIDPAVHKVNEVEGQGPSKGAGGANFCVVTVPEGSNANFVVFEAGTDDDDEESKATPPPPKSSVAAVPSPSSSSLSSSLLSSSTPTPKPTKISSSSAPTSTPQSHTPLTYSPSSSPLPTTSNSGSVGTSAVYNPPVLSSASANKTATTSRLALTPSANNPSEKQDQSIMNLPVPTFFPKPHTAAGNRTATPTGNLGTATFPNNETLYSTYPGPGSSGFKKQVTFAGFGLTVLAGIAVLGL